MKKLESLTPEQEAKMFEVRDFWLDYINSCKNSTDREQVKIGVDWLYKLAGKEAPVVIYIQSPIGCQLAVAYLKEFFKLMQEDKKLLSNVRSNVRSNVLSNVLSNVGSNVPEYESFCSYGSIGDYGWVSFYDFFTQIGVVNNKDFNSFKHILTSGVYDMIQLEGFCIVCDMPSTLLRNATQQLHSVDTMAISFKDGYGQYYINGRSIPDKYFHSISDKSFTMEDFINESNEEVKSVCIAMMQEKYGDEYLVDFFRQNLMEVDTYVNKKDAEFLKGTTGGMNVGVYTLFKGIINGAHIAYVRCYCPSTDRMFFLGVDESHKNAKDAIASLYRIPSKLKNHIKSISRQGERFSTILTEQGKEILTTLSEEEIADVDGLKGNEYFEKMQYEF